MEFTIFLTVLLSLTLQVCADMVKVGTLCTVTPLSATSTSTTLDDTPNILAAFKSCGTNGQIVLTEGIFHIGKVMDTLSLSNCDISIHGTLIWSTNIQYWLSNSISVTYSKTSTAWRLGGTNISLRGYGQAIFDGNGQLWYDQNKNNGNQPGRPISLTIWHATNVLIDGITWRQSQFWYVNFLTINLFGHVA